MHCSTIWSLKFDEKSLNIGVTAVTDASRPLRMLHGHYGVPGSKEHRAGDMLQALHVRYSRYGLAAS